MNPSNSHTHCQVAQADTQAKTWQRACKANASEKEILKNAPPHDKRQ
jgi:hypothetical protein